MSVRVHLDDPYAFYTNLDFISGRIILSLSSDETISAIVVKLEGESKTVLIKPIPEYERRRRRDWEQAVENHKILYKIQQVFPDPNSGMNTGTTYTLPAGIHEYPFRFKIPFNNSCNDKNMQALNIGFGGIRLMDLASQMHYRHVKTTLPPSLSGFPGEAEIRYYVKVTVQRPSLFQSNRRSEIGFKFLPIEPPRQPATNAEAFARRSHTFKAGLSPYSKKSNMFKRTPKPLSNTPPSVVVDARLPSPSILTCNEPIPLRIIIKKEAQSPEWVFLMALQVDLIGFTEVRAEDFSRMETNTWTVMSIGTLSIPVVDPSTAVGSDSVVDKKIWDKIRLPPTVTPSFNTCNLTRSYELEVRVVIGYGNLGDIQPQTQMLPLRFPVQVYSGIAPPPELLNAISNRPPRIPTRPPANQPAAPAAAAAASAPSYDPLYPPQMGTPAAASMEDAPPSYEDAMAEDIGPLDGPRRDYSGVTDENGPSTVGGDEKRGGFAAREGQKGPGRGRGGGGGGFTV